MILSDNGVSKVWRDGPFVYKKQPKFMTDNEIWCLKILHPYGYVPYAEQVGIETIRLKFVEKTPITNFDVVQGHFECVLKMLQNGGIVHGDLTEVNILIRNNYPYIIDFSESRLACDPRPPKRREGDKYWLKKTFEKLIRMSS